MIDSVLLKEGAEKFGVVLSEKQREIFNTYCRILLEYNKKVNLTAIIEPYEVVVKHFIDSIAVAGLIEMAENSSFVDIGTGAGFPGMVLKIVRPDLHVTLMDSQHKRLLFLRELGEILGIKATLIHLRAEQAGADASLREHFDYASARAVASLDVLCEYALPLVRIGGRFLALKGPHGVDEVDKAKNAMQLLGGKIAEIISYRLPDDSERRLICIDKVAPTPQKYPRQRVRIVDKPL